MVRAQTTQIGPVVPPSQIQQSVIDCKITPNDPVCKQVIVTQGFVNDATKAFNLVVAQRDQINALLAEKGLRVDERTAYTAVRDAYNALIDIHLKIEGSYQSLVETQQKVIQMYADLVDKLQTQMGKKKGFFDKLLDVIKTVSYILTGVVIGRGI